MSLQRRGSVAILATLLDVGLDLRLGVDAALWYEDAILRCRASDLRAHGRLVVALAHPSHGHAVILHSREARAVFARIIREGRVLAVGGVLADEAGQEARGDRFEGGNGCRENANVDLDHGPVHGACDGICGVLGGQHAGDVGDADNRGDTGTGGVSITLIKGKEKKFRTRDPD